MTTITEDYVSFEIAKLLKEKGFNESCHCYYTDKGKFVDMAWNLWEKYNTNSELNEFSFCSAPTLQITMKWLREVHNICIIIEPRAYNYINEKYSSYIASLWQGDNYYDNIKSKDHQTYEEAIEAALKYTLENLI